MRPDWCYGYAEKTDRTRFDANLDSSFWTRQFRHQKSSLLEYWIKNNHQILRQGFIFALQSGSEHFRTEFCVPYIIHYIELGAAKYIFIVKGKETAVIGLNDCISKWSDLFIDTSSWICTVTPLSHFFGAITNMIRKKQDLQRVQCLSE